MPKEYENNIKSNIIEYLDEFLSVHYALTDRRRRRHRTMHEQSMCILCPIDPIVQYENIHVIFDSRFSTLCVELCVSVKNVELVKRFA